VGGYVKLACSILDSSLWILATDIRIVFITILAMCNSEGLCEATAPGIARRANLPLAAVRRALRKLEDPDPDDKSGVAEGRRLERVSGGYRVINYLAYRDRDYGAAARARRYRERRRARDRKAVTRDGRDAPVTRTQGKGKGEAEARPEGENGRTSVRRPELEDAILTTAAELERLLPSVPAAEQIRRASRIEAGNGHPEKTFTDPRGMSVHSPEWLSNTLKRIETERARVHAGLGRA
jgi:hypothetical protein